MKENGTKTQDATSKDYTSQIEKFRSLADRDDVERLEALINQISSGSEDSVMPIVLSPDYDKSHRTVSLSMRPQLIVLIRIVRLPPYFEMYGLHPWYFRQCIIFLRKT